MTIQKGSVLVEGPKNYTQKTDGSGTTTRKFVGVEAEILALQQTYRLAGYDTTVDEGPPWSLEATLPYALLNGGQEGQQEPEPEPSWDISIHQQQQNILESNLSIVTILSTETKELIMLSLKNPGKGYPIYSNTTTADERYAASQVHRWMTIGADSIEVPTTTISRAITVSRQYVSRWDLVNSGKVLSKSTLINATNMPQWIQVVIPESSDKFATNKEGDLHAQWGYKQDFPQYSYVSNNQVKISQSWTYNKYVWHYYDFI